MGPEIFRNKETESQTNVTFGIVISNLANDINPQLDIPYNTDNLVNLLNVHDIGAEIQIEAEKFYLPVLNNKKPKFLGIHQPIQSIDFYNDNHFPESIQRMKEVLVTAENSPTQFDYVVFHLEPYDYWYDIANRTKRIARAKQWFEELIHFHSEQKMHIPLLVENLEFPKYPATIQEITDCTEWIQSLRNPHVGFAFDIAHLWRTGQLISTNMYNPEVFRWQDQWSNQQINFLDLIEQTSEIIHTTVKLIHVTSGTGQETHLIPAPDDTETTPFVLNGYRMLNALLHTPAMQGKKLFVVNEAIGYPYIKTTSTINELKLYAR